ncbi:hypothetical protein SS1G_14326 [Sclerotinia sclerotiorum 1980 UF-70]|uniref:Uncharacterized protein n=1 Tax=Sclerotinia sclerotiorum (strain ATCC 18683 / 1980 / Ss-1) TaxID=665079 RepID=A7F9P5_SCLS1|nr:hypothetical protein SS1G_14326 [Sclerotinia sclerotiorum 1980 UF-70]EDO00456.1 hypothetical protein SS1G_14326 [Sclerotinia sclerotiorum 1980 UF-70]
MLFRLGNIVAKPNQNKEECPKQPDLDLKSTITYTRVILPIYKTTNTAVLYEEAKLRPSEIELNLISQLYTARTTRLNPYHPLRIRAENIIKAKEQNRIPDTRFTRLITALPETEHINPLAFPPWEIRESRVEVEACINGPMGRTKAQAAEDFKVFHAKIPRSDIQIFSDGSKSESKDDAIGGGFVVRPRLPHISLGKIRIRWVPGHLDIPEYNQVIILQRSPTQLHF